MSERKQHVKVEQDAYLALLAKHPEGMLRPEIMEALNVSGTTALRKLEGLKAQGKVVQRGVVWGLPPDNVLERMVSLARSSTPPRPECTCHLGPGGERGCYYHGVNGTMVVDVSGIEKQIREARVGAPSHEPVTGGVITATCPHCGGAL